VVGAYVYMVYVDVVGGTEWPGWGCMGMCVCFRGVVWWAVCCVCGDLDGFVVVSA